MPVYSGLNGRDIMAGIFVENIRYEVKDGTNLLEACLSIGFNLPYFCWHPAMHSVGACRQCAVKVFKDESDKKGRIVMACMTPAKDGTRLSVEDTEAKLFRKGVIELLMTNHPHDCPVCDEGGECHLQDMTVMTGHDYRRYRFTKRTHVNQDLGPFIFHEMNRCIACYRCVRFYIDYAGGRDLNAFQWHNNVFFGRASSGVLQSPFSGNLIEVCPTGVFTDKTLGEHYTRKWDLQTAPSVCPHCSVGCNTIAGERYGMLRRILNRYNPEVNGYFICDRGRFGYEFVNSSARIRKPVLRSGGQGKNAGRDEALDAAVRMIGKGTVVGIGSPRASLEANFALKALTGSENFYSGETGLNYRCVNLILSILRNGPSPCASLARVTGSDAVLILGEDLLNTAPMLGFAVRRAALQKQYDDASIQKIERWDDEAVKNAAGNCYPVFIVTPFATGLDGIARKTFRLPVSDIARLAFAVAHEIDNTIKITCDISGTKWETVRQIAGVLKAASSPVIISGCSCASEELIKAAADIAWALGSKCAISYVVPSCNSMGLAMMDPRDPREFLERNSDTSDVLIILENDITAAAGESVNEIISRYPQRIVLDTIETPVSQNSGIVLPSTVFAESDGTFVNNECRAQRFFKVYIPEDDIQESWRWLRNMHVRLNPSVQSWESFQDCLNALSSSSDIFSKVRNAAPESSFRVISRPVARQPHRYSGRTAMTAAPTTARPEHDGDSPLCFSMEGHHGADTPPSLVPRYWAPGWNSVQALNKYQTVPGGQLRSGPASGIRLIEPQPGMAPAFFECTSETFIRRENQLYLIPVYLVYGSEELSNNSESIARLIPKPYMLMHPDDAGEFGVNDNEAVIIDLSDDGKLKVNVRIEKSMPQGLAGVTAGVPGATRIRSSGWITVHKDAGSA